MPIVSFSSSRNAVEAILLAMKLKIQHALQIACSQKATRHSVRFCASRRRGSYSRFHHNRVRLLQLERCLLRSFVQTLPSLGGIGSNGVVGTFQFTTLRSSTQVIPVFTKRESEDAGKYRQRNNLDRSIKLGHVGCKWMLKTDSVIVMAKRALSRQEQGARAGLIRSC
jgi:hypothetical protein